ncbi:MULTISPECIES: DMT family transporter [Rhizobium]|uniref:DMT family transporter n=1 Tax=Rhizobium TaxID=379 RepID=UPI0007EA8F1C|nr:MULTISPECIES: DMT family transporter [Rhizobium]ANK86526.1 DMT superfamily inner membrane transporter protein [Rhizobium sp. N731]ANK92442.1 DMT superfamily inner membrane transporter protein [Rhizobium sp. N6212]ANK98482.1 DMT superfamily inner membrane transporter protein [Rhizobium sp. N621]ANL04561.1 DMT superfamily inner membrane transporter protein [Rhizobium esperanzae]ANL10674.1 DMT superfamily inner membrane transporter protein [Rhizobium sp. N1341]
MDSRMSAWIWSLLLLLGLIWGGSFFFARIAVQHIPPLTLVFLRLLLAGLALHVYIAGRFDIYPTLKARWREFLILGLINNALPHALIFFGQTRIGAGLAAILNATTPIWTVLIANYLTSDEKLSSAKIAGCLVGLAGTIVLVGPGLSASGQAPLWALLLPVLAAISYGFAATYGKRFKDVPAPVTAAGQLTASSLITLPLSLLADRPWTLSLPPLDILLAVLALALVSTAFAYILYFRIMAAAGATNASLVTLLVPPSAILLGVLFLGERLAVGEFAGMALIGFGLVILDGRAYRLLVKAA